MLPIHSFIQKMYWLRTMLGIGDTMVGKTGDKQGPYFMDRLVGKTDRLILNKHKCSTIKYATMERQMVL